MIMHRITPAPKAIGVILPSSNRVVERVTQAALALLPDVDACFARVPYGGHPKDGYDTPPFVAAAAMLAEAGVEAICWNATRGAGLGFDPDRRLCDLIQDWTGLPATTTALATRELLESQGLTRIALVSQGDAAEGDRLTQRFARNGIEIVAARHLGITDNRMAAHVTLDTLRQAALGCAREAGPDAVLIWSTNLPGYGLMAELEERMGIPVLDSCAVGTLAALRLVGADPAGLAPVGRMFSWNRLRPASLPSPA
jgi:maleate isomerase